MAANVHNVHVHARARHTYSVEVWGYVHDQPWMGLSIFIRAVTYHALTGLPQSFRFNICSSRTGRFFDRFSDIWVNPWPICAVWDIYLPEK